MAAAAAATLSVSGGAQGERQSQHLQSKEMQLDSTGSFACNHTNVKQTLGATGTEGMVMAGSNDTTKDVKV